MLKKIVIFLVVLVVLIILGAYILPAKVHVERSTVVDAHPATVYLMVNSFKGFNRWSPWHERDPNTVYKYEGPNQGVGAKMSWESDDPNVGVGSQEIVSSEPQKRVDAHLDFGDQGTAESFFLIAEENGKTKVTWGFDTDLGMNPVARYMGLMFDKWIGPDYEKGLASLKTLAESMPKADLSGVQLEEIQMEAIPVVFVAGSAEPSDGAIAEAMGTAYGKVMTYLTENDVTPAGMPITINTSWDESLYGFMAAIPVPTGTELKTEEESEIKLGQTPAGTTLKLVHKGPYTGLTGSYGKANAYMKAIGWEAAEHSWAQYVNDPGQVTEEELETHLYFPVK